MGPELQNEWKAKLAGFKEACKTSLSFSFPCIWVRMTCWRMNLACDVGMVQSGCGNAAHVAAVATESHFAAQDTLLLLRARCMLPAYHRHHCHHHCLLDSRTYKNERLFLLILFSTPFTTTYYFYSCDDDDDDDDGSTTTLSSPPAMLRLFDTTVTRVDFGQHSDITAVGRVSCGQPAS